jgi:hypothetical protein
VHDSGVNLQRWQQSDERAALQIVRNEEKWDKDRTDPLERRTPQREEIVRARRGECVSSAYSPSAPRKRQVERPSAHATGNRRRLVAGRTPPEG